MNWSRIVFFKRDEWNDDPDQVSFRLVEMLDDLREIAGVPIVIHVAWAASGHSEKSYHYRGEAVDFHFVGGLTVAKQYELLAVFPFGAIGYYPEWNNPGWHVDLRPITRDRRRLTWIRRDDTYEYETALVGAIPRWLHKLQRKDGDSMGGIKDKLIGVAIGTGGTIVGEAIERATPAIAQKLVGLIQRGVDALREFSVEYMAEAEQTPNPWDNLLAKGVALVVIVLEAVLPALADAADKE